MKKTHSSCPPPRAGQRFDFDSAAGRKISSRADVLHVDDALLVIGKPPGLSVYPVADGEEAALDQLVQLGHVSKDEPLYSPYPLEPRVSGIVVLARGNQTMEALLDQIARKQFVLTCLALVRGRPDEHGGSVELPLRRTASGIHLRVDRDEGRPADTRFSIVDGFVGFALLECVPSSADPDQVRAHLQAASLPLAVDPDYGGAPHLLLSSFKSGYRPSRRRPERPLINRPSLHVARMEMRHPRSGLNLAFDMPMPRDLKAALHQLDRFGRVPHHPGGSTGI